MIVHMDRNTTVPNAVGKVHGHNIRVGRKLQLADNAGDFVLVRGHGNTCAPEKRLLLEQPALACQHYSACDLIRSFFMR